MKRVLRAIAQRKQPFLDLPLFAFLRDDRIPPLQRVAFYPSVAHFLVRFSDLDRHLLETSRLAAEDEGDRSSPSDDAWPSHGDAVRQLGMDRTLPTPDVLRVLFREEPHYHRLLSSRLASLIVPARGLLRLVILKAIEEAGNVFLAETAIIARRIEASRGVRLRYLPCFHVAPASGLSPSADHRLVASIELSPSTFAAALAAVDAVFVAFADWTCDVLRVAEEEGEVVAATPKCA